MPRILLIEDDDQLAQFLCRFLSSEGYLTDCAAGQTAALALFEAKAYDCVLLDISLRDGNGYAVCAAIRAQSETPVIFITASADEACTVAGFELGADDYIGKPFGTRELLARMKNVMRRRGGTQQIVQCGDVAVDTVRCTVSKRGEPVSVSALEYRLLLVFFTNKNKVLSRERLAEELWSLSKEYVSDNTLCVYIRRLREKIEDDPQSPRILRTARGLGYQAVDA